MEQSGKVGESRDAGEDGMKNIFKKYMQWAYPECEHLSIALRFLLKNPEQNKLAIEEIYFALMKTNGYFYEDISRALYEEFRLDTGKEAHP